ncbi:NUDIX hydrolase [Parabacteroides sp. OttesenSCG-928-K15]|nr:NUDIX hydrolase [Parabacteroides sp. OttesenSCG-928-K15]
MKRMGAFFPYTTENIQPGFSVDCVVFSFYKKKLRVLLNKFDFSDYWQLPGGFMFKTESSDDAAKRILATRTGLTNVYLKQFYLFSDPARTKIDQNTAYLAGGEGSDELAGWFLQRFVSLGYIAFLRYDEVELTVTKEDMPKWFAINDLPELYSDHANIIKTALETMRPLLPVLPVGRELLPEKFTMSELRKIYEVILGKALDRRNFQRKILSMGILTPLDEVGNNSSYNPPVLYKFTGEQKDMINNLNFL